MSDALLYVDIVLGHPIQLWHYLHGQFLEGLLCGDAALEEIDGRGEAAVCLLGEMDKFIGGPAQVFGLDRRGYTLAKVVSMRSWRTREETMFLRRWR